MLYEERKKTIDPCFSKFSRKSSEYVFEDGTVATGPKLPDVSYYHCMVQLLNGSVLIMGVGLREESYIFNPTTEEFFKSHKMLSSRNLAGGCTSFNSQKHPFLKYHLVCHNQILKSSQLSQKPSIY